ncbi:DUF1080 domain-containing protein [Blastopirellula sp. JC732]|uniref:DUF1080 domain-containing protein n=1 Tax=Blastopirellula sediminis TaxID=2894196 RepID=A0A9X1SIE8_9BACT|nr:DUF1080 domain-containing protein [Blastopirellula sediminis]MCC9605172.1 DUF1080 domain-containing protein [Blastopirellula sediminis]MCC9631528.1 DUF1080 domain-containing protein [Blastopirellula sediminis]
MSKIYTSLSFVCCLLVGLSLHAEETKEAKPEVVKLFDGKTLAGWKIAHQRVFDKHGAVTVKDGELHLAKGDSGTGIYRDDQPPRMNYEITLEAKRTEGDDFFCGMTFPINDQYCTMIIGGWGGGVTGLSNVDDLTAIENGATGYQEFKNDQWYKIRLRVTPESVTAWVDGDSIFSVNTKDVKFSIWWELEPMRPLGIATWNTSAALRNIEVKKLK